MAKLLCLEAGFCCAFSRHAKTLLSRPNKAAPTFVQDAHRDDGKRFVVRADEKLTAFLELEAAIRFA